MSPERSINPEGEKPYSFAILLIPGGDVAIVNESLGLAVYRSKSHTNLRLWCGENISIRCEGVLPKIPENTQSPKVVKFDLRVSGRGRGIVEVGEEYRITYLGGNATRTTFKLESKRPITIEWETRGTDIKTVLEERLRQPA